MNKKMPLSKISKFNDGLLYIRTSKVFAIVSVILFIAVLALIIVTWSYTTHGTVRIRGHEYKEYFHKVNGKKEVKFEHYSECDNENHDNYYERKYFYFESKYPVKDSTTNK